ncbi:class II glutamine amidotransferase [Intestinimonas massiliensis (ex Afouda et al. 2020)]|uniref:class II glutamine amidotransferase n=1 Tax=Intestinimonas massiliensis (ex Afouda et al. 2020) TaxID=1673721 RepID=UPI00103006DF|nr:class II glutamine amidotransferase [Intestinimonas massiliensis (ex Afouda et al. 2020)]
MCCLFGLMDYRRTLNGRQKSRLVSCLATESEARGTDAAGIAYNASGRLRIYKRPGPAHRLPFRIPEDTRVVMGHTRLTTQGSAAHNRNNHPFAGRVPGTRFALAHNGVLYNDLSLRRSHGLPSTRIETDSYVAVQLIEQQRALTPASLKEMAEAVEGSFVFTILDEQDNLYVVKGDNPFCLLHFPRIGLYLYASTETILQQAVARTWLRWEQAEEVSVSSGDILSINRRGEVQIDHFEMGWELYPHCRRWGRFSPCPPEPRYLEQLKSVAASFGYTAEQIDQLLLEGWSTDEIEDALYGCDYL